MTLIVRLWDIQIRGGWPIQLGVHFDHADPSVTFHLPFLVLSFGRLKQPGFDQIIDMQQWVTCGKDRIPVSFFPAGYLQFLRDRGCLVCAGPVRSFDLLIPREMEGTWRHTIGLCVSCDRLRRKGWDQLRKRGYSFGYLIHQARETASEYERRR